MDALSDVLKALRISGGLFLDAEFTAPWCVASRVGPEDFRNADELPPSVVAFHYVIDGQMVVEVEGATPVIVHAGEIVLLPRNNPHLLASQTGLAPLDPDPLVQRDEDGLLRMVYRGGGAPTRLVCGFVGSPVRRHPLLEALPMTLTLDIKDKPCAEWVAASFRFAAQEVASGRAGSETVLAKLSELLFVEAVRHYAEALPPDRKGWFAGLRDPAVGRSLALMHGRTAHPWTTEELAAEVHLSRSAFAERFTHLVGAPPITYLTEWRMQLAAARLRDTARSIGQIAAELGYESEATFTRAFKRAMGVAPGRYRTARSSFTAPVPC
ncbi:MAG: AraC family transcriptional regulator [Aphanothece saxicola GSE-SYN-MK-01-06B]|jgi:AraC-like DNA-binding protein|nr:AraC family transcriptional regulator [Aphanothece saxicola GSE-SYN-MK-01-06B]